MVIAELEVRTSEEVRTRLGFESVTKCFPDGTQALRPVSFSVGDGEFVSIVGPSGCGKSTLLRVAAGLTAATSGATSVDANRIGYVFQDATLLPWRTVRRNIELLAELNGVPKSERRQRTMEAIETVGLTGSEMKFPRALSGGMKMRASLARALTMSPELFLFDEPFGALDEITRERLNDELLRLFIQRRFAGLFVTHSVAEAAYLSTRVIVMSDRPGRIVADLEVPFEYPRRQELRYTAEFAEFAGTVSSLLRAADA
jgi:NitT/TauT family transport system ATP-binding protein